MALLLSRAAVTLLTSPNTATGAIALSTVSGGTPPYTVAWTSSSSATVLSTRTTLAAKSLLLPGKYSVTVTDNTSATATQTYDLTFAYGIPATQFSASPYGSGTYGGSVAVDGEYMVVGQETSSESGVATAGAAFILKRTDTSNLYAGWTLQTKVVSDDPTKSYKFGISVAIEGNTVAIGEMNSTGTGKVHIFTNTSNVWSRQITIVPSDGSLGDSFGTMISMNGDWLAVGAYNWSTKSPAAILTNCGAVYLYQRPSAGAVWTQTYNTRLQASAPVANDRFGYMGVTVRGGYVAASSSPVSATASAVYTYILSNGIWSFNVKLQSPTSVDQRFGIETSIDGNNMAIGCSAYSPPGTALTGFGAVFLYKYAGSQWAYDSLLVNYLSNCSLGTSVSMRGSTLLAGMPAYTSTSSAQDGAVALYKLINGQWLLRGIYGSLTSFASAQGESVSLSPTGKYMVWGAAGYHIGSGNVLTWSADPIDVSVQSNPVSIAGQSTGSASATGFGGQSPTLSWSSIPAYSGSSKTPPTDVTSITTSTASNLSTGAYSCTFRDSVTTLAYTSAPSIVQQLSILPGYFYHSVGGAAVPLPVTVGVGGSGSYTWQWASSGTGATVFTGTDLTGPGARNVVPGQYTVSLTDAVSTASSCSFTYNVQLVTSVPLTLAKTIGSPTASDYEGGFVTADGQIAAATSLQSPSATIYFFEHTGSLSTGTWAYTAQISVSGYARAISLNGITLVVGIPDYGTTPGSVSVVTRISSSSWQFQSALVCPDPVLNYGFGQCVSIDINTAVVGCPSWGSVASGKVYIYSRSGTTWSLVTTFTGSASHASFGSSVSVKGSRMLVGAPGQVSLPLYGACGVAYCYDLISSVWTITAQLLASDPYPHDAFGSSVSVYGDKAMVGATGWRYNSASNSGNASTGAAYIFELSNSIWTAVLRVMISGQVEGANFGRSCSSNNQMFAVGSLTYGSNGAAYSYLKQGGLWSPVNNYQDALISTGFGSSVALSSRYMIVGSPLQTVTNLSQCGAVYPSVANNILVSGTTTNIARPDSATGSIVLSIGGGYAPYTIAWTSVTAPWDGSLVAATNVTGQTGATISSLTRGTYIAVVTDSTGQATDPLSYAVTQLTILSGLVSPTNSGSNNLGTVGGSTCTGGSGVYVVNWTSSAGGSVITTPNDFTTKTVGPGAYTLTVTDAANSAATISKTYYVLRSVYLSVPDVLAPVAYRSASSSFSYSIAQSGLRLVVSDLQNVYSFVKTSSLASAKYSYESRFSPTAVSYSGFGISVALDGAMLVIADTGDTNNYGYLSFYGFSQGTWTLGQKLTSTVTVNSLALGTSLRISGNYVMAGSLLNNVYVFKYTNGVWAQTQILASPDSGSVHFGFGQQSIALTSTLACVGDTTALVNSVPTGCVYVYSISSGTWTLETRLTSPNSRSGDAFGTAVDISGTTLVIGAPTASSFTTGQSSGLVYVFDKASSIWSPTAVLTMFNTNGMGYSVAIDASATSIAATVSYTNAVVFSNLSGSWIPSQYFRGGPNVDLKQFPMIFGDTTVMMVTQSNISSVSGGVFVLPKNPIALNIGFMTPASFTSKYPTGAITAANIGPYGGGTPPYTYSWTTVSSTFVSYVTNAGPLQALTPGTYTLTVSDSVGISTSYTYVLPNNPLFTYTPGTVTCPLRPADGVTQIQGIVYAGTFSGGVPPYTNFIWSTSLTQNVPRPTTLEAKFGLPVGTYTAYSEDSVGARASFTHQVVNDSPWSSILYSTSYQPFTFAHEALACDTNGLLVVGAPALGAIMIYRCNSAGTTWNLDINITGDSGFGSTVAIKGNYVAVTVYNSGVVYVYYSSAPSSWVQVAKIYSPDVTSNFGVSLAMTTSRLAIGSPNSSNYGGAQAGVVRLYSRGAAANSSWTLTSTISPLVPIPQGYFGGSLGLSADTLVVGSALYYSTKPGSLNTYYDSNGTGVFVPQQTLVPNPTNFLGGSIGSLLAFDGTTLLVVSTLAIVPTQVYTKVGGVWTWTDTLYLNANVNYTTIRGAAVSGSTAIISTATETFCYQLIASKWSLTQIRSKPSGDSFVVSALSNRHMFAATGGGYSCAVFVAPARDLLLLANRNQILPPLLGSLTNMSVSGGSGTFVSYQWTSTGTQISQTTLADLTGLSQGTYTLTVTDSLGSVTDILAATMSSASISIIPGYVTLPSASSASDGSIGGFRITGGSGAQYFSWSSSPITSTYVPVWQGGISQVSQLGTGSYIVILTDAFYPNVTLTVRYDLVLTTPFSPTLKPANPTGGDQFSVVAVSGLLMAVGAFTQGGQFLKQGAVYFFKSSGYSASDTWSANGKVSSDVVGASFFFGQSISMDGATVVIGEPGAGAGRAHIYTYDGTTWTIQQRINGSTNASGDLFGASVGITGSITAVGSPHSQGSGSVTSGAIFVFTRNASNVWSQTAVLMPVAGNTYSFGVSVSVDSGVIVGASNSFGVQVHVWSGTAWTFSVLLSAPNLGPTDQYFNAAVSGDFIACGKYNSSNSTSAGSTSGFVDIFRRVNGVWSSANRDRVFHLGNLQYSNFGLNIGLKGNTLLCSVLLSSYPVQYVNIFRYVNDGTNWYLQTRYTQSDSPNTLIGATLAVTNTFLAVGAPAYNGPPANMGAVYTTTNNLLKLTPGIVGIGSISAATVTGGAPPYAYSWSSPGATDVSGVTTAGPLSRLSTSTYTLTVTDFHGTVISYTYTTTAVFVVTAITLTPAPVGNVTRFGQANGTIGVTTFVDGVAPFTYIWNVLTGTSTISDPTLNTTKAGLGPGTYRLQINDSGNLTGSYIYTITENPPLFITSSVLNVTGPNTNDGSISASVTGGTGSYSSFSWTSTSTSIPATATLAKKTGLRQGTYNLTVIDSSSSTLTKTFVIGVNAVISVATAVITPVLIYGQATGQISAVTLAGGSGVYSYSWSSGTGGTVISSPSDLTAKTLLSAASYTLVVTDDRLVTLTYVFVVTQSVLITYSGGSIVSSTGSNGSIAALTINSTTPIVSYAWTNSAGASAISTQDPTSKTGLKPGTYTLRVVDSNGGVGLFAFLVLLTAPIAFAGAGITHSTLYSSSRGFIAPVFVTGGFGALSYVWTSSAGATNVSSITGGVLPPFLFPGTYQLSITDAQLTVAHTSYIVGQPIYTTVVSTNQTRSLNGTATVTALGGLGAYSYAWTKDGSAYAGGAALTNLVAGVYQCTVTTSLFSTVVEAQIATFMTMDVSPTILRASWTPILNATGYAVIYGKEADPNLIQFTAKTLSNFVVIPLLTPLTLYRVSIFVTVSTSSVVRKYYSDTVSTPAALSANYNKATLQVGTLYNIVPMQTDPAVNVSKVLTVGYAAGDTIQFDASIGASTTQIVGTVSQKNVSAVIQKSSIMYIPFDITDTVSSQTASLTLQDGTTKTVSYQQTGNSITLNGTVYNIGDVLFLDGQKVTILKGEPAV